VPAHLDTHLVTHLLTYLEAGAAKRKAVPGPPRGRPRYLEIVPIGADLLAADQPRRRTHPQGGARGLRR